MKVLIAHNYYQQPGGEDQVFADEGQLLESRGHQVLRYTLHNDSITGAGKLSLAAATIWNRKTHKELGDLVAREQPEVVHFHNTFPQISPAAYYAAEPTARRWFRAFPITGCCVRRRSSCGRGGV